eukprot:299538_1
MSVKYNFDGKLVLVTGSTKGIGKVIAEEYVKYGASVIINSRKQLDIDIVVKEFKEKYNINGTYNSKQQIYGIAADLGNSVDCNTLIQKIDKIGHLDILINNASIFYIKPFEKISDNEWKEIMDINIMSTVRLCRSFLPKMLKINPITNKPNGGNIIFISSDAAISSSPKMLHYSMTKAAQLNISRGLAELTKGINNVRINSILVGPTMTENVESYFSKLAKRKNITMEEAERKYFKKYESSSLKQKFLDPHEIANGCLFLTSDAASGINGSAVKIEGGKVRSMI